MDRNALREQRRKRAFTIIEIGSAGDTLSRGYDLLYCLVIAVNLFASILYTFEEVRRACGTALLGVEIVTAAFFAADYFLRLWTAGYLFPGASASRAALRYARSFSGIVDLLSFLPYCLPFFFPAGAVAFRVVRVVRIFRLFRINAYYDALNVISQVLSSKRQQLISSVFIILLLMISSSLCMYSLEHEAQPEVFANAFSGIWWSVSALLTVGYGDIYPITTMGQIFGIFISFLGVGMVAIPTGIISAGFVEQYSHLKRMSEYAQEKDVQFIPAHLNRNDHWVGMTVEQLNLPSGVRPAAVRRGQALLLPTPDILLTVGDTLLLAAEAFTDTPPVELKELLLRRRNPWLGQRLQDLDISRKTVIIMVQRKKRILPPDPDLVLQEGDRLLLYTQMRLPDADTLQI